MKTIIAEVLKIELIKTFLSEGRIEDTKAKYPEDGDVVDYFVSQDPSGNNKYLAWEMKIYKQLPTDAPDELKTRHKETIGNLINVFHQNSSRLEKKDINQYKSLADLHNVMTPIIKSTEEKSAIKEKESGVKKLYEDDSWLLVEPLTHEASCKYGANTKWCTTATSPEHFGSYTDTGSLIYLIYKKTNDKFAFYYPLDENEEYAEFQIFNPKDHDVNETVEGDLRSFFNGLVGGEMEDFLKYDGQYAGVPTWCLYEFKNNIKGDAIYCVPDDEDDQVRDTAERIWEYMFRRGSGRNTPKKIQDAFARFGMAIILGKKDTHGRIPWTLYDEDGDEYSSGLDLSLAYRNQVLQEIFMDFIDGYIGYMPTLKDKLTETGIPLILLHSDEEKGLEGKKPEYLKIMNNKQAKAMISQIEATVNEKKKEIEKRDDELIEKVSNNIEIIPENPNLRLFINAYHKCPKSNTLYSCMIEHLRNDPIYNLKIKYKEKLPTRRRINYNNTNLSTIMDYIKYVDWEKVVSGIIKNIFEKYEKTR